MDTVTLYVHTISGDIQSLEGWRDDMNNMDRESWSTYDFDADDSESWTKAGLLEPIDLVLEGQAHLSDALLPDGWHQARDGEEYTLEWIQNAVDADGERYKMVWHFPAIKGQEPKDDGSWPWEDSQYLSIKAV